MATVLVKNFTDGGNRATLVAERRKGRLFGIIQNLSDSDIAVGFSSKTTFAAGENAGIILIPKASISFPELTSNTGANETNVYAVHGEPNGDAEVRWIELPTTS